MLATLLPAFSCLSRASPAEVTTLLVFPLEDRTGSPDLSWVAEGVALSLSETLHVGGIATVDREELTQLVEQADLPPGLPLSRASMIRVGQLGAIDGLVFGSYSGTEQGIRVTVRFLDLKTLRLAGAVTAHGPLAMLPELENELAWNLLNTSGLCSGCNREAVRARKRSVPNGAFSLFVRSLQVPDEEEQIRLLERAVGIHKLFPSAQYRLGRQFVTRGDCASAITHLEPVRGHRGIPVDALLMLGTCYLKASQIDAAIQVLSGHLSFSRSPDALNNLGVAYLHKGDLAIAAEFLSEARRSAPLEWNIVLNIAVLRHLQQNAAALIILAGENPQAAKSSALMQFLLGDALARQGERAASEEAFTRARLLGVDIGRLRADDPHSWTRILSPWSSPEQNPAAGSRAFP